MVKIQLSLYNTYGAAASITDGECSSVPIVLNRTSKSAKTICKKAAARLRKLADKFDKLAETDSPFKIVTQDKINRR